MKRTLIVELKKGGFLLKQKELDQARDYAKELRNAADVRGDTEIIGYVLGADAEQSLDKLRHGEHTAIHSMIYRTLLDRAHSRTFNLQRRIQESQPALVDPEVEEVLASPNSIRLYRGNALKSREKKPKPLFLKAVLENHTQ